MKYKNKSIIFFLLFLLFLFIIIILFIINNSLKFNVEQYLNIGKNWNTNDMSLLVSDDNINSSKNSSLYNNLLYTPDMKKDIDKDKDIDKNIDKNIDKDIDKEINKDILAETNKYYSDFKFDVDIKPPNENDKYSCNGFFNNNSFCNVDFEKDNCNCKFQKDDLRYSFYSPETCCKKLCRKYSPEKCITSTPFLSRKYYCRNGDSCEERNGIILNSRISANNCGNDPLNNQLLLPYADKKECEGSLDVCDKHNIKDRSINVNKSECLKDSNCGFCSNNTGGGKCISGTAEGPLDLNKYYYCAPASVNKTYSYDYGNQAAYLLQK